MVASLDAILQSSSEYRLILNLVLLVHSAAEAALEMITVYPW